MSISITNTENILEVNEKTRNLYDNYDNLVSVVKYDSNKNVDYVLKAKSNTSGKSIETQKYEQVTVDVASSRGPTDVTFDSVRIRGRVYKNNNSKVFETGVIYWKGNANDSILNKPKLSSIFETPTVFKGNFSQNITDLQDNSTYNYRLFVRHEYGTNYSKVYQFQTQDFSTVFQIVGDRFSGPAPLTVNLSAVNAGFGPYTYAWNMTGGNIGFKYPLNSITVTFSGQGYTPSTTNYTLQSITINVSGNGYGAVNTLNRVLVNGVVVPELTANLAYNNQTSSYGVTSVSLPVEALSGFTSTTLNVTFAPSADGTSMFFVGIGDGNNSPYTDEALIATSIQSLNPAPNFVIHTGDINQEDTESSFVNNWLPLWNSSPLLSSMYLAFGNHDLQDGTYGDYLLNYLPATNDEIGSTNRTNKKYCYDFVKGLCHFFVINTGNNDIQSQGTSGDPFADINGQLDEIVPKIQASKSRWKIFVCHRPPYTNDELHRPGFFGYAGAFWSNIKSRLNFASLGIDLVLNGHGQQYSVFQKDGVYFVQNGSGGAIRRNVTQPFLPETVINIANKAGYIKYYADFNNIKWEFIDVENSNSILDTRTITKTSTISQPASGSGTVGGSYQVTRVNSILVDGTLQPSLSVITYQSPETGNWGVSSIQFLSGSLDYFTAGPRTVTLQTNGSVDAPVTLRQNSSITITNAEYNTRTITHTFSSGGNFTPKVYALFGDQIQKQAVRIVRVTGASDYSPEWQTVLTSPYANNIIAAYDFRNLAGSPKINEFPVTLFDFEPENVMYPTGGPRDTFVRIRSPFLPELGFGGYGKTLDFNGYVPFALAGYVGGYFEGFNAGYSVGGYDETIGAYPIFGANFTGLFGAGLVGENGTALRFAPLSAFVLGGYDFSSGGYAAGYSVITGQRWIYENFNSAAFSNNNPFSVSLWANFTEFRDPGTKIFSLAPFGIGYTNTEFSITQSTSALKIFKNTRLDEQMGGYFTEQNEPIAGYLTGYPMLCTTDSAKMLTPNAWNHMVVTRDKNRNYKYYKNGALMLSASDTNWGIGGYDNIGGDFGFGGRILRTQAFGGFGIGGYVQAFTVGDTYSINTNVAPASGLLDSLAVWQKELSEAEVIELYNSGQGSDDVGYYKPIIGPKLWIGGNGRFDSTINTRIVTDGDSFWDNVSLYAQFDGTEGSTNIIDSSTNNVPLSSVGATISTNIKRYGTGSALFNPALSGYVTTLSGEDYGAFGTEDFTIEWWDYLAGYGTGGVAGYVSPIAFFGNPGIGRYGSGEATMVPQWGITRTELGGYGLGQAIRLYMGGFVKNVGSAGSFGATVGFRKYIEFQDHSSMQGGGPQLSAWSHNVIQRKRRANDANTDDYMYFRNGVLKNSMAGYQRVDIGSNISPLRGLQDWGGDPEWSIAGYGPGIGVIGAGILGGYPFYDFPEWYHLDGYIDELRITKGIARYSSNFTPPTTAYPTDIGEAYATRFVPVQSNGGSFALTQQPVTLTYPHTIAFVGNVNATVTDRTILQNIQTVYNNSVGINLNRYSQTERALFSVVRPFDGGSQPSNSFGGYADGAQYFSGLHPTGGYPVFSNYIPSGNEWFYLAYSFLGPNNNNEIRYYLQTPTVSGEGIIAGYSYTGFSGLPSFGIGGYAYTGRFTNSNSFENPINTINGDVRLGMYINQGFNTHASMVSLYQTITAGPANNITLQ